MEPNGPRHQVITSISWIPRGVPATKPQHVKLEPSTLREIIEGTNPESTEDDQTTEVDEEIEVKTEDVKPEQVKGIRGSLKEPKKEDDEYDMENYDEEKVVEPSIKGLTVFGSNLEDPHVTKHEDSEDEAEVEDMMVNSGDNLVVAAKFEDDDATLVVYLYNTDGDFYVHHDYPIAAPILCMEPVAYDPGVDGKKGNLLAVGTMNPAIEVWDLDIVNAVKPLGKLGGAQKGHRKKRDNSAQCHTDAVLSLAWNREADHLLASGGADELMVLWDLDAAKPAQNMASTGMVQTLDWQPGHASVLLAGTRSGSVQIHECQSNSVVNLFEDSSLEVERVYWDRFNENLVFILTSNGKLRYVDARQPGKTLTEVQAHDCEGATFTQSSCPGLFSTAGDEEVKLWRLSNHQFELLHADKLSLGRIHSAAFNPDVPNVMLIGGEKNDLLRLYDSARSNSVSEKFPALKKVAEPAQHEPDGAVDDEMEE